MTATASRTEPAHPGLVMSRLFDAPRDLMFRIWTEPKHLLRWWAPHDFTVPHAALDARPGGRLRIDFRWPNGVVFENYGDVVEVTPPERLVFTTEYREHGRLMVASLVTATFDAVGGKTRVTIRADVTHAEPEAADSLAGMEEGWNQQIDKLELHAAHAAGSSAMAVVVPADRPVVLMRRKFAEPRELVWNCFTHPGYVAAWWGPHGRTNTVTELDARKGGKYRFEQSDPNGNRFVFFGDYIDVLEPERLVNSFSLEGQPMDKRIVNTQLFEDVDGDTLLTAISRFPSVADRDGMVAYGMEHGARQSYDRLASLIDRIKEEELK